MIAANAKLRGADFGYELDRLMQGVRKGFIDPNIGTLSTQGRLLAQAAQRLTPPRKASDGKIAVRRDTNRAAYAIAARSFTEDKRIRKIVHTNDQQAWRAAAKHFKDPRVRNTHAHSFSESLYKRARNNRGRVTKHRGDVLLGPQAKLGRRYVNETVRRVGWAKAGWNHAIIVLKGKPTAAWAAKFGQARGFIQESHRPRQLADMWIRFGNDTAWGQGKDAQGIARLALKVRRRAMRTYFEKAMRRAQRAARR